jgi:hypothetical protein
MAAWYEEDLAPVEWAFINVYGAGAVTPAPSKKTFKNMAWSMSHLLEKTGTDVQIQGAISDSLEKITLSDIPKIIVEDEYLTLEYLLRPGPYSKSPRIRLRSLHLWALDSQRSVAFPRTFIRDPSITFMERLSDLSQKISVQLAYQCLDTLNDGLHIHKIKANTSSSVTNTYVFDMTFSDVILNPRRNNTCVRLLPCPNYPPYILYFNITRVRELLCAKFPPYDLRLNLTHVRELPCANYPPATMAKDRPLKITGCLLLRGYGTVALGD